MNDVSLFLYINHSYSRFKRENEWDVHPGDFRLQKNYCPLNFVGRATRSAGACAACRARRTAQCFEVGTVADPTMSSQTYLKFDSTLNRR
jgi:hypothetical protein